MTTPHTFRQYAARLALLIAACSLTACDSKNEAPLSVVDQVDVQRYLGVWHQLALIPNRFQAMCVTDTSAEYKLDDDHIQVINRCRKADGSIEQATGIAKIVEGSHNAKLRVSFFRPFYGNYWILALDPDYRWVVVGEPGREYGWILARSKTLDAATMNHLWQVLEDKGYKRAAFQLSPEQSAMTK